MMFNEPRNWKWIVPGVMVPFLLLWWGEWSKPGEFEQFAIVPLGLMFLMGLACIVNLVFYVYANFADIYSDIRSVQNNTPEVMMFEAARGMHPEAVKALLVHRRTIWRIKYVPLKDVVDWVLDEVEFVHAGFVDFVLDHSSSIAIMPKRMLSDGSKGFDPSDIVTDYEQYDALILLMQNKLMLTNAYGNQAPQWIPPWNPNTVRHRFGLDESVTAEPEAMSEALLAVVRAQTKDKGNGMLKQLSDEGQTRKVPAGLDIQKEDMPDASDDELDAIHEEMERYGKKFVDGKVPS